MSVSVKELLKLPCLGEARVVGGEGGLGKTVTSVTVLEYADVSVLQDALFENNAFFGSELVISGFINIKDDVEAQCANIRRLAAVGEVGLILYYVGIFVPKVDRRLIEVANELDFVLICMPENRFNIRYSEVIVEVMEAIFKDQSENEYFVSEILTRISQLPPHQQTIETAMKMISDRIHSSLLLTSFNREILNLVVWPRGVDRDISAVVNDIDIKAHVQRPTTITQGDKLLNLSSSVISNGGGYPLLLTAIKENIPERVDFVRQAAEVIRISLNLFSRNHSEFVLSELVRAILSDEPHNMRRLAEFFKVDVASINSMWVLHPKNIEAIDKASVLRRIAAIAKEIMEHYCQSLLLDVYRDSVVIFADNKSLVGQANTVSGELYNCLEMNGIPADFVTATDLLTTTDVRNAYLAIDDGLVVAKQIFKNVKIITLHEINFAIRCKKIVSGGEIEVDKALSVLNFLNGTGNLSGFDAVMTLEVYLLDAQQNIKYASELMFVHNNTMKYRIQQISEKLGYSVDKMPESSVLYLACAINRLLN